MRSGRGQWWKKAQSIGISARYALHWAIPRVVQNISKQSANGVIKKYAFECFAHSDKAIVLKEIGWLAEHDVPLWYDRGISAGTNWRATIGDALLGADKVIFFISSASLASNHCNREISLALDEGKTIIPIYLHSVELPL